jgi:hypothetical protein
MANSNYIGMYGSGSGLKNDVSGWARDLYCGLGLLQTWALMK